MLKPVLVVCILGFLAGCAMVRENDGDRDDETFRDRPRPDPSRNVRPSPTVRTAPPIPVLGTDAGACPPGPDPGPPASLGGSNAPCAFTSACAAGLVCNYNASQATANEAPFGTGCGLCQSGPTCPPVAPFWAGCGGAGQPGCPPYVSRGVAGTGCTWPLDCALPLTCKYGGAIPAGFCGLCD